MRKRPTYIESVMRDLNKCARLLKESYVFDEEETPNEYEGEDESPYGEWGGDELEPELASRGPQDNDVDDKIAQIRKLALDGIQEFSEDVESEEYVFYKKVWMECDKLYTERNEQQNGETNQKLKR
jgi:hypothetical protein